jgi:hypothetical protein
MISNYKARGQVRSERERKRNEIPGVEDKNLTQCTGMTRLQSMDATLPVIDIDLYLNQGCDSTDALAESKKVGYSGLPGDPAHCHPVARQPML